MEFFKDTYLLFRRHVKKTLRMPIWLFMGLSQPVLFLLLYMPLLKNVAGGPGLPSAEVVRIFVPGMLIIMGMGSLFAGFGFIPDIRQGIIARWLVTPASRFAILFSLVLSQMATLVLQAAILLGIAFALGLEVSAWGVALTLILLMLIGAAMASVSYAVSLSVQNEQGLASVTQTFYLPVMLLSGIMLPISLAPQWLKTAASYNPFYYAVEASRALFAGNPGDSLVIKGFAIMSALCVVAVLLAVGALRKMSA